MTDPVHTDTGSIRSPISVVGLLLSIVQTWSLRYMFGKGVMIALLGFSWIIQPSRGRLAGIEWMDLVEPWMIGLLWLVAGLWAVVASWLHSATAHRLAWFGLIFTPLITALYFSVSWTIWLLPGAGGAERGWITAVSYGAFAMAYCVSKIQAEVEEIGTAWRDD